MTDRILARPDIRVGVLVVVVVDFANEAFGVVEVKVKRGERRERLERERDERNGAEQERSQRRQRLAGGGSVGARLPYELNLHARPTRGRD
jgi:hypothetical protein